MVKNEHITVSGAGKSSSFNIKLDTICTTPILQRLNLTA
jgi:hypothetical protein